MDKTNILVIKHQTWKALTKIIENNKKKIRNSDLNMGRRQLRVEDANELSSENTEKAVC